MTTRWPAALYPKSCSFGRSRNPAVQSSQSPGHSYEFSRGRPLWTVRCTFETSPDTVGQLRDAVETSDGMINTWLMHDFANPWPCLDTNIQRDATYCWYKSSIWRWKRGSSRYYWKRNTLDYSSLTPTVFAAASIGDASVTISGFMAGKVALVRGDLIEIDERLYMVASTVVAASTGRAIITLSTPLLTDITTSSVVVLVRPSCVMRVDEHAWKRSKAWSDPFGIVNLKFIEVP